MAESPFTREQYDRLNRLLQNKRFNRTANAATARQALTQLEGLQRMLVDTWIRAESDGKQIGHSPFVRTGMSRENQRGLKRIATLSAELHRALIRTGAGHVYVRLSWRGDSLTWRDDVNGVSWRALLADLSELERVAREQLATKTRKTRGNPGNAMHRNFAVLVGHALERFGYAVSTRDTGHYATVLEVLLTAAGLKPTNLRKLVNAFHDRKKEPPPPYTRYSRRNRPLNPTASGEFGV